MYKIFIKTIFSLIFFQKMPFFLMSFDNLYEKSKNSS